MRVVRAVALVLASGLASACGSPPASRPVSDAGPAPALESHLSCAGSLRESMIVDYVVDEQSAPDPRTPEQMAKDYGDVVGRAFSGQTKVVYRSAEEVHIGFVDGEGRVQAVLSYRDNGPQGWHLETGMNCA